MSTRTRSAAKIMSMITAGTVMTRMLKTRTGMTTRTGMLIRTG
jgi:hypothetical protein